MKIAACAICKDEEQNIPRWLERTGDFDYRVVVDTGSSDASVRLLKEAGVIVAEHVVEPFRFDVARNSVLPLVPSDVDWLIWPDFDEYYNWNCRSELERVATAYPWLTRITYQTFVMSNGAFVPGEESGTVMDCKIHRRGMYHWEKPLHEYLSFVGEGDEVVKHVPSIVRYHEHHPSHERAKLYASIAEEALSKDPSDAYLLWFVLKHACDTGDNIERCQTLAKQYLHMTSGDTNFRAFAAQILRAPAIGKERKQLSLPNTPNTSDTSATLSSLGYRFGEKENTPLSPQRGVGERFSWGEAGKQREVADLSVAAVRSLIFDLSRSGDDLATIELARTYLAHVPDDTPIINEHAGALYRRKRFKEALELTERLARSFPDDDGIAFNLAKCYHAVRRPDDAEKLLRLLRAKDPNNREYILDHSLYLSGIGNFSEAERLLRSLSPDARVNFNLGWYEMRKGNFQKGFLLRDDGRKEHLWGSEHLVDLPREKRYAGGSMQGKKVLLFGEGGLGDEMIFARFAGIPRERGAAKVMLGCAPSLVGVFTRAFRGVVDEVLAVDEARKRYFDTYVPLMNAPNLFGLDSPSVSFPYLVPEGSRVAFWKEKLGGIAKGRLKIGIRWAGNPKFEHEQFRTINPQLFMELGRLGQLFSLQRDWGSPWLPHNQGVYDLQNDLTDWDETLAVLANLDVVVSSCTSIVHASGALGVPTCVVVPIASYFPWAVPVGKSEWYPSVSVFRQKEPRSWRKLMEEVYDRVKTMEKRNPLRQ